MSYKAEFSDEFLKIAKKLKNKDSELFRRLKLKVMEIVENPEHYKSLKGEMKGFEKSPCWLFWL